MENILDKNKHDGDDDNSIRPITLENYTGQEKIKKNIEIYIKSALKRDEPLDHILFFGPPGLGKTTLAGIIAHEMGKDIKVTTGPTLEKPGDLASLLMELEEGDILFIDEIHSLNKKVEEILYPAMEDYVIDILIGSGNSTKSVRIDLPKFTLIGATTRKGMISAPLLARFCSSHRMELYTPTELSQIIKRDAKILNIDISDDALLSVASRSRGTPRVAIRLLKRLRDVAIANDINVITMEIVNKTFELLDIDENGLDATDLMVLNAIHDSFNDGPAGLDAIASCIGEDKATIEDVCEPFLMQCGLIAKTRSGRILTEAGKKYIKS